MIGEPGDLKTKLTGHSSSQSQNELVLLGVLVLGLRFGLLVQRLDEALERLASDSQEGLKFSLHQHVPVNPLADK